MSKQRLFINKRDKGDKNIWDFSPLSKPIDFPFVIFEEIDSNKSPPESKNGIKELDESKHGSLYYVNIVLNH